MPEIWLKYGTTDVVLDIRYENLLKHIYSSGKTLTDGEIRASLENISLVDNLLVVALSGSISAAKVIDILQDLIRQKNLTNVMIDSLPHIVEPLRINVKNKICPINKLDYKSFSERVKKFQKVILISNTRFDPLFGFSGSPTALIRNFEQHKMVEAYNSRNSNLPTPAVKGPPLDVALSTTRDKRPECIEIIGSPLGVSNIYCGSIVEAFDKATSELYSRSILEGMPSNSAVISPCGIDTHHTLSNSLDSLWNCLNMIKRGGSAILLAESRGGLGSVALKMYLEGKINLNYSLQNESYIDGLEHLLYLQELQSQYDLGILSTLPRYYLMKLSFHSYRSTKDILERLNAKFGKNQRVLVISDADVLFVKSKIE